MLKLYIAVPKIQMRNNTIRGCTKAILLCTPSVVALFSRFKPYDEAGSTASPTEIARYCQRPLRTSADFALQHWTIMTSSGTGL
jgi:hypothetical protein